LISSILTFGLLVSLEATLSAIPSRSNSLKIE